MEKQHSKNFNKVKLYFEHNMWSIERVHIAIGKWITEEEYKEIIAFKDPFPIDGGDSV